MLPSYYNGNVFCAQNVKEDEIAKLTVCSDIELFINEQVVLCW